MESYNFISKIWLKVHFAEFSKTNLRSLLFLEEMTPNNSSKKQTQKKAKTNLQKWVEYLHNKITLGIRVTAGHDVEIRLA